MFNGFCDVGSWGSFGNFDVWAGIGPLLSLIFLVGLIAVLAIVVVWALRRARVSSGTVAHANGRPTAKESLQAQYARGEITREQYKLMKQDIG